MYLRPSENNTVATKIPGKRTDSRRSEFFNGLIEIGLVVSILQAGYHGDSCRVSSGQLVTRANSGPRGYFFLIRRKRSHGCQLVSRLLEY